MKSAEIRQSFLDFFHEKQHTIVPSASLLPQSPGLLFTNAGMNQFVPYFLGTDQAPYQPARAADTQKCIRAGGKHNDLEDVGYDTYHHTMFEMLGNWSFGDYFKKEAISWAWELVVERWGLPANRLYASVYAPKLGDPGHFDQEAWDLWADLFRSKGVDPEIHIVHGNVKDNFWMMGETGPCGPCSELHVDLTPNGDSLGKLVNNDSDLCIEIWNLVFIQYNAEADGSFRDLPAKHVDTGMGFERACSIIQNTKGFTDFSQKPANYATDVFTPIFAKLEELSGKTYVDIYPAMGADRSAFSEEMKIAIAFRVIADHLRTLSFSIADGILPGNNGRNYVLRRILRRAVRYGRQLGFSGEKPFFGALVETLVAEMGGVFPELKSRQSVVRQTLEQEEASFNQTLDRGLQRLDAMIMEHSENWNDASAANHLFASSFELRELPGEYVFELYDTYGFPKDLTDLVLAECGWTSNETGFEREMSLQQERSRAARKSTVVRALDISTDASTEFVGFDADTCEATVLEIHPQEDKLFVITDKTVFYAEMGGQVGDAGSITIHGVSIPVLGVQQIGKARALIIPSFNILAGESITLHLDAVRRRAIEAHHTATHLLHWALHEVVSADATQQGSSVDEYRLRFDCNSTAISPAQLEKMQALVNEKIAAAHPVSWIEVPHSQVKGRPDVMQFFGDKYGETVRVVQIGGVSGALDGYSMELCGGTHIRNTADIGQFIIKSESAIAAGVRRIEAACGEAAQAHLAELAAKEADELTAARAKLVATNAKLAALGSSLVFAPAEDTSHAVKEAAAEAEKAIKKLQAAQAASLADATLAELLNANTPIHFSTEGDVSLLQELLNSLKKHQFSHHATFLIDDGEKLHLAVYCGATAKNQGKSAGALLSQFATIASGKGGGNPEMARGAAPDRSKRADVESAMRSLI
jgi:alanyl-tRNA synthetase